MMTIIAQTACVLKVPDKTSRDKTSATKHPVTKRPATKCRRPNIRRQNIRGKKRPEGQNVLEKKCPGGQNVCSDKKSRGTKRPAEERPAEQNVRGEKENVRQGKKSPLISGRNLVITLGNNVRGRKNAWQGKKSPLSQLTQFWFFRVACHLIL
jgi:hypothetical protein